MLEKYGRCARRREEGRGGKGRREGVFYTSSDRERGISARGAECASCAMSANSANGAPGATCSPICKCEIVEAEGAGPSMLRNQPSGAHWHTKSRSRRVLEAHGLNTMGDADKFESPEKRDMLS